MGTIRSWRLLAVGAASVVLGAGTAVLARTSGAAHTSRPTDVSRAIAQKYLDLSISKKTSRALWLSVYAPDIVIVDGGSGQTTVGLDSNLRMWRNWLRSNPGLRITGSVWAAGPNWAAVVVTERTQTMLHHDIGIEQIRNGRIVHEIDYYETTSK
jgi:hypothetical protein